MRTKTIGSVLVAALLVGVAAAPAAALAGTGSASSPSSTLTVDSADATQENNSSVNVTVGQQLSTVVATTNDEVQTDFEDATFEVEYEGGDESDRAEAIADRNEELRDRAEEIRESYREATESYEDGDISRSEYAQRVAELNARAENVLESHRQLQERADNVSDAELSAAGVNQSALQATANDLDAVTGTGADALLQRFTGQSTGEVEIESSNGVEIEVSSEDGERSREFQRSGDGDTTLTVNESDALDTARAALSGGNWSLDDTAVDGEDGIYEFEFVRQDADGEAEVTVDGSGNFVVSLEEEIESDEESEVAENESDAEDEMDDENETDDENESDDENETADGNETMSLGATVENDSITVTVTRDGSPVENATVYANDRDVGTTDADGTLTFAPPNDGEENVEIAVEKGDLDVENTYDYPDSDGSEDDDSDDDSTDTTDDDSDDTTDDESTDDDTDDN
jgi:nitrogen fixation protein FixH